MKLIKNNESVSEIMGTLLLLIIGVLVVSAIIITVVSTLNDNPTPEVNIFGKLDDNTIILEHQGGDILNEDTVLLIDIGEQRQPDLTWSDFEIVDSNGISAKSDGWEIGELLLFDLEDNFGPINFFSIDVRIIEDVSKHEVMYGRLKPGLKLINLGGIWHFDEGKGPTAKDSLNANDGAVSDENSWINTSEFESASGNASMHFNGLNYQKVVVPNDVSLIFSKNITINASLWPTEFSPFIDEFVIEEVKFGQTPHIVRVNDKMVGVAMENQSKGGTLVSIDLDEVGFINSTVNQSVFLEKSSKQLPIQANIIHLKDDLFVLAYHNVTDDRILIKTYFISSVGEITYSDYSYLFDDVATPTSDYPNKPQLAKIDDQKIAVVFCDDDDNGVIYTFEISSDGLLTMKDNDIFDNDVYDPSLASLNSDTVVVSYWYEPNPTEGRIRTISISAMGDITLNNIESVGEIEFFDSSLFGIDDDTMFVCYKNDSKKGEGMIKTFDVSSSFDISFIDELKITNNFEGSFDGKFYNPDICNILDEYYGIVFSSGIEGRTDGYFFIIEIDNDGIIKSTGELKNFEDEFCFYPNIDRISDEIVGVVYEGKHHKGTLKTLYVGDINVPIGDKGFVKQGTYGFWANTTTIYAWINDQILSLPVIEDEWNNIYLTYDSEDEQMIRFYNNYNPNTDSLIPGVNYRERPYDQPIADLQKKDLIFGRYYSGYIDEIYILDEIYYP